LVSEARNFNQKLIWLLDLIENLGVNELKYFQHRSRPSLGEMFLTLGETMKEIILQWLKQVKSFRILADKATDCFGAIGHFHKIC